jgi:uncharacterized protein YecT (DUF1311 family)
MPGISCALLLVCLVKPAVPQSNSSEEITPTEIKQVINQYAECDALDQIKINHLEYFDFRGEGHNQAVIVASTCMTGTAGADVHAVYERDAKGKLVEHSLDGIDPVFGPNSVKLPVFGNRNYGIAVENGQLVARWGDTSDREHPLVIWYKWDGKAFILDHMKVEGPFPTSYDCSKATGEVERAICYSPRISALDVQLSQTYEAAWQRATSEERKTQEQQQRQWLAERKKECTIYKWWVDCLNDLYTKRILELKEQ